MQCSVFEYIAVLYSAVYVVWVARESVRVPQCSVVWGESESATVQCSVGECESATVQFSVVECESATVQCSVVECESATVQCSVGECESATVQCSVGGE